MKQYKPYTENKMDFCQRLISLRERYGYTQNALAERAGVSQSHLRRVERGEADITIGHLQLLCDAMNISLSQFFDNESGRDEMSVAISQLTPKQRQLLLEFIKSL